MLEHGGRLREAANQYGIPLADWLDLSTGLAPWPWPIPSIPTAAWTRLPEAEDGLEQAAREYYGAKQLLPVAGSQAAIQALPRLRAPCRVAIIGPCYAEHQRAWERAGHQVSVLTLAECDAQLSSGASPRLDVVVLVNPDNPTGRIVTQSQLLAWHQALAAQGGWLVVDEAFADLDPVNSLTGFCQRPGLIVLRSIGKFFGLAGIRLGFVFAPAALLAELNDLLGPWAVSGPARVVGQAIFTDAPRQRMQRERLGQSSARLQQLLKHHGLPLAGGCALFQWVTATDVQRVHQLCAERGILLRLYRAPLGLRIGLPGNETAWQRLDHTLKQVMQIMGQPA